MNNTSIKDAAGSTVVVTTVDLGGSPFAYPTTGQAAAGVIYCGPDASTPPTPVTAANPLPVNVVSRTVSAATTDSVAAKLATDAIHAGATALTPKFAALTITSGSGDQTIVNAVAGKRIRVLSYMVSFNSAVAASFKTGGGSQVGRTIYGAQYASQGQAFSPVGHFQTALGEALLFNLASSGTASVNLTYVEA